MTDDWDFYFLTANQRAVSVYVDLGAIGQAPVAGLPHLAYVRLRMNAPREDGLSSQSEFEALMAVEDALQASLVDAATAYLGRWTSAGGRDFFFYVKQPGDWDRSVAKCMQAFPRYRFEAATRHEPDWATYRHFLYPSDEARQRIGNRRVCAALERQGDPLTTARPIRHWAYFPDAERREAFVSAAAQLGFAAEPLQAPEAGAPRFCAQVWRTDIPAPAGIDGITLPLFHLAQQHGGEYDGWETQAMG